MFLAVEEAAGTPYAPLTVTVYERPFEDQAALDHLREVMQRLLPHTRSRITRDRFSLALPRWVEIPGFDPEAHTQVLPPPGDGTLRAVLDWAQEWALEPLPHDGAPWRTVYFEGVTVDGAPGRLVSVGQTHHAVIDGQGATRIGREYLQFAPDGPLPAMPPAPPEDDATAWGRWKEGWALEGAKAASALRANAARARWALQHPRPAARRARELAGALHRMRAHQGSVGHSHLLTRRSQRLRFDHFEVDLSALKAGARAVGGTVNDGFMAALSIALHRWHLDEGHPVAQLRTAMAINTRTEAHGVAGNEVIGVMLGLPLEDDPALAVKRCQEVSRAHREDRDVLWLLDRFRALSNRMPRRAVVAATRKALGGVDLQISNVQGVPARYWVGGVETLRSIPFPTAGPSALALILLSRHDQAEVAVTTDPAAIPDPAPLVARLVEGFAEVIALGS